MNAAIAARGILRDAFGRTVNNLRISVTDRCNFRCSYCMPEEGMRWLENDALLTFDEITRMAGIFAELGVSKIRLTGGEPLMRKDLHVLIATLRRIPGISDIALTTNGYFLAQQASLLAGAGLSRINVSMDSLDPAVFSRMVRRDYLHNVREGIAEIGKYPVHPVKINVVLIRGINDHEIGDFARLARTNALIVRFIEFMPIGADDGWSIDRVVPTKEIIDTINASGTRLIPVEVHGAQPADRYRFEDGKGEIGFISSVSAPFCTTCNRVRLTSDGKLRTCLFSLTETDVKQALRAGASDDDIRNLLIASIWKKEEGHHINRPDFVRPDRTMSSIGG